MCNRFRMTAKQAEVAVQLGIDPALIMPEPGPLPPPELFPKRLGYVVRKEAGARLLDVMTGASRRLPRAEHPSPTCETSRARSGAPPWPTPSGAVSWPCRTFA